MYKRQYLDDLKITNMARMTFMEREESFELRKEESTGKFSMSGGMRPPNVGYPRLKNLTRAITLATPSFK